METDVSGASFSEIDLETPQSEFTKYLDTVCPYFMLYGMTYEEFWFESIDRFYDYWQQYQFDIERRNQELWLQGLYIQGAVAAVLDSKHKVKYPEKPYRLTDMTDAEREIENKRKVERLREHLNEMKRRWDTSHKKGESVIDG